MYLLIKLLLYKREFNPTCPSVLPFGRDEADRFVFRLHFFSPGWCGVYPHLRTPGWGFWRWAVPKKQRLYVPGFASDETCRPKPAHLWAGGSQISERENLASVRAAGLGFSQMSSGPIVQLSQKHNYSNKDKFRELPEAEVNRCEDAGCISWE